MLQMLQACLQSSCNHINKCYKSVKTAVSPDPFIRTGADRLMTYHIYLYILIYAYSPYYLYIIGIKGHYSHSIVAGGFEEMS